MVHAGRVFVASIHPSRTRTSESFESVRWNVCVHRLDLGLYSHTKQFWVGLSVVACLTSKQHASVSQGRIFSDKFTCCHTEIQVAGQSFYLTQSQYTDTGPTSPSADPITPGAWQGSHWSANFEVTGMTRPRKKSRRKRDSNPGPSALEADALPFGPRGGRVLGEVGQNPC